MTRPLPAVLRTVLDELFPAQASKSQRRQLQIVEETIEQAAKQGFESIRYEQIAESCGVSRALVQHYFPKRERLVFVAIQYIRGRFQQYCIEAVLKHKTPRPQLEAYVEATFQWLEEFPSHARVWLLFYYYSGIDPEFLALNTRLVRQGHERIEALLQLGVQAGEFTPGEDLTLRAKMIQNTITGALLTTLTEETPAASAALIRDRTISLCLDLAEG